jgi:hypothetical protein
MAKNNKAKRYSVYKYMYRSMAKHLKKQLPVLKKETEWNALIKAIKHHRNAFDQIIGLDFPYITTLAQEYNFLHSPRHTIFIESSKTIDSLLRGKYTMKSFSPTIVPYEEFMICLPANTIISGMAIDGLLVNFYKNQDMPPATLEFIELIGLNNPHKNEDIFERDTFSLKITYSIKGEKEKGGITLNKKYLDFFIQSKDAKEFRERSILEGNILSGGELVTDVNDDYGDVAYGLLSLLIPFLIYIKAKPNALRQGLPTTNIRFDGVIDSSGENKSLFTGEHTWRSVDEHTRSWFIRQLNHEKYYKGEHENTLPGSRFVFVSETTVNMGENIEHIEENKKH